MNKLPCKTCLVLPLCKAKMPNIYLARDLKCNILNIYIQVSDGSYPFIDIMKAKLQVFWKFMGEK